MKHLLIIILVAIIVGTMQVEIKQLHRDVEFHKMANDMLVRENAEQARLINMQRDRIMVLEGN